MFTYEDFKSLAGITDRDELMSAVAQIPEEDLRTTLYKSVKPLLFMQFPASSETLCQRSL